MVTLLADENLKDQILDGLLVRQPELDVIKAKDVGLLSTSDDLVLAWAADHQRIVLTHDKATLIPAANRRLREGMPMPGVVYVRWELRIGTAIDHLELLLFGSPDSDLTGRVHYLPLQL